MAKQVMRSIKMPFKEVKRDEDGNPIFDKKTGEPVYKVSRLIVKCNAAYWLTIANRYKADNPTC